MYIEYNIDLHSTVVGVRERGGPEELDAIYIGRKRNSNQSIKPIQDSGLDSAGSGRSGQMSSSTRSILNLPS